MNTDPTEPATPVKTHRRKRRLWDNKPVDRPVERVTVAADEGEAQALPPPPDLKRLKLENCPKTSEGFTSLRQFIEFVEHNNLCDNYVQLTAVVPVLKELDDMVGMSKLKLQVIHQVIYHITGLNANNTGMHHTVIAGKPGCGKTQVAKIMARLYHSLGFLSTPNFKTASRDQLVGRYLGETSIKTKAVLEDARGGVLFIDEVYSLGCKKDRDSFSKECIDTITQFLSENGTDFVMIAAGYADAIRDNFFAINSGLERRFPFRYDIDEYSPLELKEIFIRQVRAEGWKVEPDSVPAIIFTEKQYFANMGGDCANLFMKVKLAHSIRAFLDRGKSFVRVLNSEDIESGFVQHQAQFVKELDPTWNEVRHIYGA